MRETRPSGSEGGGAKLNWLSLPLSNGQHSAAKVRRNCVAADLQVCAADLQ